MLVYTAMSTSHESFAALVERARLLLRGPRSILGIAGAPGSGKSTLAAALVGALGPEAVLVPMDGFHLAQAELVRLGRADRKGAPDTFDPYGYVALLRRLASRPAHTVYCPTFDRSLEEPVAGAIAVDPGHMLVVTEGNYLLLPDGPWAGVRALLDDAWFVEVDDEVRVERLVARHVAFGRSPEAAREWVLSSDERNARLVTERSAEPDVRVAATAPYA